MMPTIGIGDRVIVDRMIYRFTVINHGDVIAFKTPDAFGQRAPFIKRVIGLPSDTIEINGGKILVNGQEYNNGSTTTPAYQVQKTIVPEGMLYVLGDNRNESADSQVYGPVPIDNIIGRVISTYWPPDRIQFIK